MLDLFPSFPSSLHLSYTLCCKVSDQGIPFSLSAVGRFLCDLLSWLGLCCPPVSCELLPCFQPKAPLSGLPFGVGYVTSAYKQALWLKAPSLFLDYPVIREPLCVSLPFVMASPSPVSSHGAYTTRNSSQKPILYTSNLLSLVPIQDPKSLFQM